MPPGASPASSRSRALEGLSFPLNEFEQTLVNAFGMGGRHSVGETWLTFSLVFFTIFCSEYAVLSRKSRQIVYLQSCILPVIGQGRCDSPLSICTQRKDRLKQAVPGQQFLG
jgi:hypothetical protein